MREDITIEIGTTAEEMGRRFIEAWHEAERGEIRACRPHLIFETAASLSQSAEPFADNQPKD